MAPGNKPNTKEGFHIPRTITFGVLIAAQIAIMISFYFYISKLYLSILAGLFFLTFLLIIRVVLREGNPGYKISWIVALLLFQPIMSIFYLLWGEMASTRKQQKRHRLVTRAALTHLNRYNRPIKTENSRIQTDIQYLHSTGGSVAWENTAVTYLNSGEMKLKYLLAELKKAENYIFLEYFIIAEGYMWDSVYAILKQKVRDGVDVRLIVDDLGSTDILPRRMRNQIRADHIKLAEFNRFRPFVNFFMNYRDHRKIVVIDGHTAFTGGINLADEYINKITLHGHWKDASIMLKGGAVYSFTTMFLKMWEYCTKEPAEYEKYHPCEGEPQEGIAMPFDDGPTDDLNPAEGIYMRIINNARNYVYIQTPYLIVDNEMLTALISAAHSGIDIKIVTPGIPDKWYVHAVTRTYYKRLVKAGVEIYEYTPGFIHSKVFVSDDVCGVVGTINMDYRSLYLHFECGCYLAEHPVLETIKTDFYENVLAKSKKIELADCHQRNFFIWLASIVLRIFAPLL